MRPNLNWEGYADAARQLQFLCMPMCVEIIRMIASNRHGMTERQVIDNSHYGPQLVRDYLTDLHKEGFLTIKSVHYGFYPIGGVLDYYQCNWKQIKSINKAISRLP